MQTKNKARQWQRITSLAADLGIADASPTFLPQLAEILGYGGATASTGVLHRIRAKMHRYDYETAIDAIVGYMGGPSAGPRRERFEAARAEALKWKRIQAAHLEAVTFEDAARMKKWKI